MSAVSHTLSSEPRGSSRFPTVGSRTYSLARESVYSTFAIVLTMLCRVDSTNFHCHQRLWTNSTSTFLPSSVTGKNIKLCAHASMPNFVSFSTLAHRPCTLLSTRSGLANEAVSAASCGLSHIIAFLERGG